MSAVERVGEIVQLAAFMVGDEEYVVDIQRTREIIRMLPITPVRHGPRYVKGVISLRGSVIPVVDMRQRFGLVSDENPKKKIVILTIHGRSIGLIVDRVTEVVRVPRSAIRPAPRLLAAEAAPFFAGVCEYHGRTLILLNVRSTVSSEELIDIKKVTQALTPGED